ncbi:Maf family protein [Ferruginibacter yonginensis]|uniref:dTTP/UTP pyrophosphatase n=1 Tax=Ferruginibacter yonginensis TaxID=1310416 RepID=A0ABV8QRE6_9BACT
MSKIILASQSPRRKELLQLANIVFEVLVANTDESYPPQLSYNDIAVHIATQKAMEVAKQTAPENIIIAADTIVVCNNKVLGKPIDSAEAMAMLTALSGTTHQVITGVCILKNNTQQSFADVTHVSFNTLTPEQIAHYVNVYKPYDKAGGYAIQEWIGAVGIHKIEGDYYNVMGLPINKVVKIINALQA